MFPPFSFFHTGKTRTCFLLRHIFRNKLFHVHPCIDFLWSGNTQFSGNVCSVKRFSVQSPLKMWGRKVSLFKKSVFRYIFDKFSNFEETESAESMNPHFQHSPPPQSVRTICRKCQKFSGFRLRSIKYLLSICLILMLTYISH